MLLFLSNRKIDLFEIENIFPRSRKKIIKREDNFWFLQASIVKTLKG